MEKNFEQFIEQEISKEKEPKLPQIRLEFFRHDQPGKAQECQPDEKVRLTPEGRQHATEIGKKKFPRPRMGFVYASPRERTHETALRQFLSDEDWITGETSLEEINEAIRNKLPVGKKLVTTEKLNFRSSANPDYSKEYKQHFTQTKDILPFLVYESDELVRKLGDSDDYSYSRLAANVAELVKKYIDMYPRIKGALQKPKYKDEQEMQRFFGTHATVAESFLLKIIEKTEGKDALKKFIDELPSKMGLNFSEGISIIINGENENTKLVVNYGSKSWKIDSGIIDEIIKDRTTLDKSIKQSDTSITTKQFSQE